MWNNWFLWYVDYMEFNHEVSTKVFPGLHNDVIGLMPEMDSGLSSFKMAESLF